MSRQPWFKFFPTDWRADPQLRMCSLAARGLWIELLGIMHEANERGSLTVNGSAVTPKQIAVLVGCSEAEATHHMLELEQAGVFSRRRTGVIYSRRMERDEIISSKNRDNGRKGGAASLGKDKGNGGSLKRNPKPQKPEARSQNHVPDGTAAPHAGDGSGLDDEGGEASPVVAGNVVPLRAADPARAGDPDSATLSRRLRDAAGPAINEAHPAFINLAEPYGWLAAGCDLEADIVPVLAGVSARHAGAPVRSWRYFAGAVMEARDRRLAASKPGTALATTSARPARLKSVGDRLADAMARVARGEEAFPSHDERTSDVVALGR